MVKETERIIICAILAGYAIFIDIQAAILRSSAASIHDFQVLPLMIWAAVMSATAVVYVSISFRSELREASKRHRKICLKKKK